MITRRESFWSTGYPAFMARDLTRNDLRAILQKGLEQTAGSYKVLVDLLPHRRRWPTRCSSA